MSSSIQRDAAARRTRCGLAGEALRDGGMVNVFVQWVMALAEAG